MELRAGLQDAKDKIAQLHNVVQSQSQDLERSETWTCPYIVVIAFEYSKGWKDHLWEAWAGNLETYFCVLWSCAGVLRAAKEIKTLNRALDIKLKDESPQGHTGDESSVATLVRRGSCCVY